MDRSEVKLQSSEKEIVMSYTPIEILKQKNLKLLKPFFLETAFMTKLRDTRGSNLNSFSSTDLKFDSFIAK